MDYISKNIDDMTMDEIKELCQNPEKYGLKWGEYMKLMEGLERAINLGNSGSYNAEVQALKLRVQKLENTIANMTKLIADVYMSLGGNE